IPLGDDEATIRRTTAPIEVGGVTGPSAVLGAVGPDPRRPAGHPDDGTGRSRRRPDGRRRGGRPRLPGEVYESVIVLLTGLTGLTG
ncbi:hypothetical protein ACWD4P_27580, partial [Kitasatospora sp. NPDC002543]